MRNVYVHIGNTEKGGAGFAGTLCIAFIVLKLCKVIDWSWWWVLAPLWVPIIFMLFVLCTVISVISIKKVIRRLFHRR